jgi:predicted nucleotidyltransferase
MDAADTITPEQVQAALAPVFRKHGVRLAFLFGSVARREPSRHSDVDVIVVKQTAQRFLERYTPILRDLNSAIPGHPVEPLIYTPEEFGRMRQTRFGARALGESVCIYESDEEPESGRSLAPDRRPGSEVR